MRRVSLKRAELNRRAKPVRDRMISQAGQCMLCGCSPKKPNTKLPLEMSQLCVHEIANGPVRSKAIDKPYATLVSCWACNGGPLNDKGLYPETRQLAILLQEAPEEYDLEAYIQLTSPQAPNRITQEEVNEWWRRMYR
jgi:hypothetical protein